MKKYSTNLSIRLPEVIAEPLKSICTQLKVNESDFVRKSLISEIQRFENSDNNMTNRFEYI